MRNTYISFVVCRRCKGSGKGGTRAVCHECKGHGGRQHEVYAEELNAQDWDRMPEGMKRRALADLQAMQERNWKARKEAEESAA